MDLKNILIGLIIGLIVGAASGYGVLTVQNSGIQGQMAALQTQVSSLKSEADKVLGLQQQITSLQNQLNTLTSEKTSLQNQLNTSSVEKNTLQSQVNSLTLEKTTLQNQIAAKDTEIANLNQQIANLKNQLPPSPPSQGEAGSSRFFPANIGTSITVNYVKGGKTDPYTAIITVTQAYRGDAAWEILYAANQFNDPPISGYEYTVVKVKWQYVNGPTIDTTEDLSWLTFECYSGDGAKYSIPIVVEPEPKFDTTIYPGGSFEGYLVYQVLKTDTKPMIAFGVHSDGTGGIWLRISA